jgi:NADPH:quinone reductase-like Zn-dependent oxidoreductase
MDGRRDLRHRRFPGRNGDFLRLLGVDHIFDSAPWPFADEIMDLTAGQGVDVVLNSLAGEAVRRNFGILKPFRPLS